MARKEVKGSGGQRLGYTEDFSTTVVIYDKNNRRLGHYDKNTKVTVRANGTRVGTGDMTVQLLTE